MKLRLILLAALCVTLSGCNSRPPTPTAAQLQSLVENEVKKEHPKSTVTLTGLEPLGSMGEFLMVKFGCTDYSTKDATGNMVTYSSVEGFYTAEFDKTEKKWKLAAEPPGLTKTVK